MGVHIGENKLVITIEAKTFGVGLPSEFGNNLKHKIDFIINLYN